MAAHCTIVLKNSLRLPCFLYQSLLQPIADFNIIIMIALQSTGALMITLIQLGF